MKKCSRKIIFGLSGLLLFLNAFAQDKTINLTVHPNQITGKVDVNIYGQFLEHIYHSINGGLWGEVVWNRSFEEAPSTHGNWLKEDQLSDWKFTGSAIIVSGTAPCYIPIGTGAWRNYELSLTVRKTGGKGPIIIAVRHDRGNSLQLVLGNKKVLRNMVRQNKDTLARDESGIENGKWYNIRISYNNSILRTWIDDKPLFESKVSAGREAGHFALGAENGGEGEFKNMKVTTPEGEVLFEGMPSPARHWQIRGTGTELVLDTVNPLNSRQSMKIIASAYGEGLIQKNFCLKKGDTQNGSVWLKGHRQDGIVVRLRNGNTVLAEQKINMLTANWKEYPLKLTPLADAGYASLEIVSQRKETFWVDQVVLMPNSSKQTGGFRPDLLKAVDDIHPASIRWPGGSYVGGFKWKNTIGPQHKRIGKSGWDDLDPLAFGVDEFLRLCAKVGAEPVMVVNIGSRRKTPADPASIQDICDLVEYCNGPATGKWGAVRGANGHPEPYNIKYWELDNEVWSTQPDVYASIANEFAVAMKKIDPRIILIACGSGSLGKNQGQWPHGDEVIANRVVPQISFISTHHYEGPGGYATGPARAEVFLDSLAIKIKNSANQQIKIYMSEWNLSCTDWRTGLYAGGLLNVFERNSEKVSMACPALFMRHVSAPAWDNAFINFDHRTWFPAPNYVIMKLYRDNFAPFMVNVEGNIPNINIVATKSEDGKNLFLKIVNPYGQPMDMAINIADGFNVNKASLTVVSADSLTARNTLEKPLAIAPLEKKILSEANLIKVTLPDFSVGVIKISKK